MFLQKILFREKFSCLFMSIVVFILVVFYCFKRPIFGLALLLQTNIIRGALKIDYVDPCFGCPNEPDIFLGMVMPLVGFSLILLRSDFIKKEIKYPIDVADFYFFSLLVVLLFTSAYAYDTAAALGVFFKFLFLSFAFFFTSKIVIANSSEPKRLIGLFLLCSYWLSILFGIIASILYVQKGFGQGYWRLTIPGVHPIPYSQLIGLGAIASFLIFVTNGAYFNIKSKFRLNFNKIILPFLLIVLFATNTRGVMVSFFAFVLFYIVLSKVKIKKSVLYISGSVVGLILFLAIAYIDFDVLFERLFSSYTKKSTSDRFIAYYDSLQLFINHPFGIGSEAFQHFSILPYPHNYFLELIAQYGIFGLALAILLALVLLYMFFITIRLKKRDNTIVILFCLVLYFLIEAMFSFTIWMHKGLCLTMGFFMAYFYIYKTKKVNL